MSVHTPRSVVVAALMQPVPCPRCSSTVACRCVVEPGERRDWQADLIVAALEAEGLLAASDEPEQDIEVIAQWLAVESRHARYTATWDAWKQLLDPDSENNIHHAHAAAQNAHPRADRDYERALSHARDALLHEITVRRAVRDRG